MRRTRGMFWRLLIILCGGKCGRGLIVDRCLTFKHPPHGGITIGPHVTLGPNTIIDVPNGAVLELGYRCKFTAGALLAAQEKISIGADTLVGEYTSVRDSHHGIARGERTIAEQGLICSPVIISNDVWIGRGVVILPGASIGTGAVIAANSVVRQPVNPFEVVGGAPSRHLKWRT